ncbi:tRNA (guanosine(37)-N1)-methyltransferase TrmD [Gottschalkiaceae bacterium SANA]|nr:tRNA (guanosine(37)-N1)-methyltransferase TrmD [Gottschalkiaceae bacterium SANA]
MKIDILTLFPDFFAPFLTTSIIGRAITAGQVEIEATNIRDYAEDKHKRVDDYCFGGGPGMLMKPEPLARAIDDKQTDEAVVIYLSPKGEVLTQELADELAMSSHLVLVCGHYEGIDQRVIDSRIHREISIGDYVLTGGELPAMVLSDSIIRLLPGVLKEGSADDESLQSGLLEYPQYTRPRVFEGAEVPEVLLSGNHKAIDDWRREQSLLETKKRRQDLYLKHQNKNK